MSQLDPSQPPEERIQQAMAHGPNVEAAGRFGPITRYARKLVGRAVKYERDFNLQVDVALLDRLHEVENELRSGRDARWPVTDDNLRVRRRRLARSATSARARTSRSLARVAFSTLETSNADLHSRVHDADKRAAVANSIASGAADGLARVEPRPRRSRRSCTTR